MTKAPETFACPACRTPIALEQITDQLNDERAFNRLVQLSVPLAHLVLQYVALFTPEKQHLTLRKKVLLIAQLLPGLQSGVLTHKGREWPAPLAAWAQGIEQMLSQRAAGRLELPMTGHGYLYAIVAGLADKHEATQEQQRESELRTGPRAAAVHGPASVAELVQQAGTPKPARPADAAPAAAPGTSPTVRAMREQIERNRIKGEQP